MIQATTPTYTFELPFDVSTLKSARVTFAQRKSFEQEFQTIVVKDTTKCSMEGTRLSVTLTQEETLLFRPGQTQVQLHILTIGGQALATRPQRIDVCRALCKEVLT